MTFTYTAIYSACRRRGGVLKCPRFWFFFVFFSVSKVELPLMGYTAVQNTDSSRICRQNTQFNMYTTTSKQQEGCTFKDSHPKCFITTNFDKFHREAFARGGESRWCSDSMFPWYTKSIRMAFVIIMILFDVKANLYGSISLSSEKIYTWQSRFLQMFINWCFWY